MADNIVVRPLDGGEVDTVLAFWRKIEGLGLDDVNDPAALTRYLARNPGISAAAHDADGTLVGVMIAGHDGRRGLLHHVAVLPRYRGHGLGRRLIEHGLAALKREGLEKCHLLVFRENERARRLLEKWGWHYRDELLTFSIALA